MPAKTQKNRRPSRRRLVRVAVAQDRQLAEQYRRLLGQHAIPAHVCSTGANGAFPIALYVRERNAETAYRLIETFSGPTEGPPDSDWLTDPELYGGPDGSDRWDAEDD